MSFIASLPSHDRVMIELKGIGVSPGVAIRRAFLLDAEDFGIAQRFIRPDEVAGELARFEKALEAARKDLAAAHERERARHGDDVAQIFKFHQLMLEDRTLLDEIRHRIKS